MLVMKRKIVSEIILTMLLTGILTMALGQVSSALIPTYPNLENKLEREETLTAHNAWSNLLFVDNSSSELIIGINDEQLNSHNKLFRLVVESEGKIVDEISMGGKVVAFVIDMPSEKLSSFIADVESGRLSRFIEPNTRVRVAFVPNDPYWSLQWGPVKIEAEAAWNATMGDPSILVAVIDSGVDYNHPDLADNYVELGYDWVAEDLDPMDNDGHGTHVAGIIAATINNSIGVAGLAQVRLMAEKVFLGGWGTMVDIVKGIIHAVDKGADILNLSFCTEDSQLLRDAIKYAYNRGALVVAAAGNTGRNVKAYPAAYNEVIAVTATDQNDKPATFTSFGEWVELAAPGVDIYSTNPKIAYSYGSGTSFAAPHVVGVAALVWSKFRNVTRDWVRMRLRDTADDLGDPSFDAYYGWGRINARKAVQNIPLDHDLLLMSWERTPYIRPEDLVTVNATILNYGLNDENNIEVQLWVNGSSIDFQVINFLRGGASTTVSFLWKPTAEGRYNVTVYAMPVFGESVLSNNAVSEYVEVRNVEILKVPEDFVTIQTAIDYAFPGDAIKVAPGVYPPILIDKSLTLVGENRSATVITGGALLYAIKVVTDNVAIMGFTIQDTITLEYSTGFTFTNNSVTSPGPPFDIRGYTISHFIHNIDSSNTINGKPIYYLINRTNLIIDPMTYPEIGYLAVVNSTGVTIKDFTLTNDWQAVFFAYTSYSMINNVKVMNQGWYASDALELQYSSNNVISGNMLQNNQFAIGISLRFSCNNIVANNTFSDNRPIADLQLWFSNNNTVVGNTISRVMSYGIRLYKSSYNTLRSNNVTETAEYGIRTGIQLYYVSNNNTITENTIEHCYCSISITGESNGNIIYHNNFLYNKYPVGVSRSNIWDDGYPSGGNYWSDYTGVDLYSGSNQDLPGSDGVGDTPYIIDADNVDHYPLMNPYVPPPPPMYSLTITATFGGTTDPAPGTYTYTANSTVQVTAIPEASYLFEYWELDSVNIGSANPYSVYMDKDHTLKAVFSPIPPLLSVSISPLSASILVGQSVAFTSTVSGGYTPYSYQWYLNGNPVSGATSNTWTFTPTTSGIFYIDLKVKDAKGNTAQSDTARITAATVPVGGYSIPIQTRTKAEPVLPYIALIATLTAILTKLRPKTKRKR